MPMAGDVVVPKPLALVERPRRLRRTEAIRRLVRETALSPSTLVQPLFVVTGRGVRRPIPSLPGQFHLSPDEAAREAEHLARLGVGGVILFGLPDAKDAVGSSAEDPAGPVPEAIRRIKERVPEFPVVTDVCLCEYTDHGHCGLVVDGKVDNDATLPHLASMALVHARAGADVVAPSDMMDGRVRFLREALDGEGHAEVAILSYAVKYASAFYGPFREAAASRPAFGDRRSYQMDPGNRREALREAELDVREGADMLMVKPALPYLDVLRDVRERVRVPVWSYQVSGEYAMIEAAAERGWIDRRQAALEALTAVRRAGADVVITYYARAFAEGQL
jgi:porphobilinogen synthase